MKRQITFCLSFYENGVSQEGAFKQCNKNAMPSNYVIFCSRSDVILSKKGHKIVVKLHSHHRSKTK